MCMPAQARPWPGGQRLSPVLSFQVATLRQSNTFEPTDTESSLALAQNKGDARPCTATTRRPARHGTLSQRTVSQSLNLVKITAARNKQSPRA